MNVFNCPTLRRFEMRKVQQGFTLIELMIVVAIIGILAAIAVPAYQDYTARSQASESLSATGGLRADLAVAFSENNAFPAAGSDTHTAAGLIVGKYFPAGAVSVGAADGVVSVLYATGVLAGQTMTLTPTAANGQISQWTCTGLTNPNHIPSGCR
jgi:type IV pilus assembly protein PilA